jgi:hypothetical protein
MYRHSVLDTESKMLNQVQHDSLRHSVLDTESKPLFYNLSMQEKVYNS